MFSLCVVFVLVLSRAGHCDNYRRQGDTSFARRSVRMPAQRSNYSTVTTNFPSSNIRVVALSPKIVAKPSSINKCHTHKSQMHKSGCTYFYQLIDCQPHNDWLVVLCAVCRTCPTLVHRPRAPGCLSGCLRPLPTPSRYTYSTSKAIFTY